MDSLEPSREIVDGQQRIRTILSFVDRSTLPDYNPSRDDFSVRPAHNKELADKFFADFPKEDKQRLLDYQFSVHILPSDTDDREVLQIFARMNATGLKLNNQEIRNSQFFGEFKTSMYGIAAEQLARWRSWGVFTENQISRMQEVELTSEFVQFMIRGVVGKTQKSIDLLYAAHDDKWQERQEAERRFRHCMELIEASFGIHMRTSNFQKRAPFFALFCAIYELAYGLKSPLKRKTAALLSKAALEQRLKLLNESLENNTVSQSVSEALTRRTTNKSSRQAVITHFRNKLSNA